MKLVKTVSLSSLIDMFEIRTGISPRKKVLPIGRFYHPDCRYLFVTKAGTPIGSAEFKDGGWRVERFNFSQSFYRSQPVGTEKEAQDFFTCALLDIRSLMGAGEILIESGE